LCSKRQIEFAKQSFELKPYDADNETFLIPSATSGDIFFHLYHWRKHSSLSRIGQILSQMRRLCLFLLAMTLLWKCVTFGDYTYDGNTKANYAVTNIDYNFAPIEISNLDLAMSDYNFDQISSAPTITVSKSWGKDDIRNKGKARIKDIIRRLCQRCRPQHSAEQSNG